MTNNIIKSPKVIIGLGNPGPAYSKTRHNIGFMILDELASKYHANWSEKNNMSIAKIEINATTVLLIKPQTFMNNSGNIVPHLLKQGIKSDEVIIVHDELEFHFGKIAIKLEGSAKGHNGLKSFINAWGDKFARLRVGIARPVNREDVPDYVLQNFKESRDAVQEVIDNGVQELENLYK